MHFAIHLAIGHDGIGWNKSQISLNLILKVLHVNFSRTVDHNLYDLFRLVVLFDIDAEELNKELLELGAIVLPDQY